MEETLPIGVVEGKINFQIGQVNRSRVFPIGGTTIAIGLIELSVGWNLRRLYTRMFHLAGTVLPKTVNSATPGVMPFGEPRMTNRARVPVVGLHSR